MHNRHYICLPCRFTAKASGRCPLCRQDLLCVGPDFHAPRKRNANQWRKLELLVAAGIRYFRHCNCWACGQEKPRYRTLADAKALLRHRDKQ